MDAEIATHTITSKQDAVEYLTRSLLYHRLTANPSDCGMTGRDVMHVLEYLWEVVESSIGDHASTKCVEIGEDDVTVSPLNLGQRCAYYGGKHSRMEMVAASLTPTSQLCWCCPGCPCCIL